MTSAKASWSQWWQWTHSGEGFGVSEPLLQGLSQSAVTVTAQVPSLLSDGLIAIWMELNTLFFLSLSPSFPLPISLFGIEVKRTSQEVDHFNANSSFIMLRDHLCLVPEPSHHGSRFHSCQPQPLATVSFLEPSVLKTVQQCHYPRPQAGLTVEKYLRSTQSSWSGRVMKTSKYFYTSWQIVDTPSAFCTQTLLQQWKGHCLARREPAHLVQGFGVSILMSKLLTESYLAKSPVTQVGIRTLAVAAFF